MATAKKSAPKKAQASTVEVTPVSAWKKGAAANPLLTLPGGNVLKVRKAGFQTFIKAGIIPNSLMAIVQSSLDKGVEPDMSKMLGDPEKIDAMLEMMDNVVIFVALEPKIHTIPMAKNENGVMVIDEESRDEDLLYIDEVDEEDKMFIFGWATGGTDDVETFRKESADSLAALQRG